MDEERPMIESVRAVDCHAHIFCKGRTPIEQSVYQPHPSQEGTAAQFLAVLDAHGFSHGLLVGAGPYGPDNSCMVEAIATSRGRLRGIGIADAGITDRELGALADAGVVGIRFNLFNHGLRPLTEPGAARLLARMKEMGLFVQVQVQKDELVEAAPILRAAGVRLVFDHFGRPSVAAGVQQPGFQALLAFGREGHAIKLSGPFRASTQGCFPWDDVDPFIAAAIDAFTIDRCVWGSDWPFVRMDDRMDYGPALACLARWVPGAADREKVLWHNPARLFGFS
jgi:predicted TIM-barrel fold metal-dependent hydrolase